MMQHTQRRLASITAVLALFALGDISRADEIEDKLRSAFKAYQAKEYSTATSTLREVVKALEAKAASAVTGVLPVDIGDWAGSDPKKEDLTILGGGTAISRVYKDGDKSFTAKILKDSPLVDKLMALFANEDLIKLSGAETRTVSGETAVLEGGDGTKPAKLRMAIDGRILVELTGGKGVKQTDLLTAARRLDLKTLKEMK